MKAQWPNRNKKWVQFKEQYKSSSFIEQKKTEKNKIFAINTCSDAKGTIRIKSIENR